MRSTTVVQAHKRAVLLRRVMLAIFCITFVAIVAWALPWLPGGPSGSGYDTNAVVQLALTIAAWVAAFGVVYLRDLTRRYEQTMATWTSVRDGLGEMRRREYFYERIVHECHRAKIAGEPFAVFTLRYSAKQDPHAPDPAPAALDSLGRLVRSSDNVAPLGPQEIGVLVVGAGSRQTPAVAQRLKTALVAEVTPGQDAHVNVGWAVYGADGLEANALLGAARDRMQQTRTPATPGPEPTVAA